MVTSSLMTLHECKNGLNVNKVRFFDTDQLSSACKESWDRVKIVCTQPYIKQAKFGLSFITFHSRDKPQKEPVQSLSNSIQLGSFTLRYDEQSDDFSSAGRLFAKRHEIKEVVKMPESPVNRLLALHKKNLEIGKLKNTDSKKNDIHSPSSSKSPNHVTVKPNKMDTSLKKNNSIISSVIQKKGMIIILMHSDN